MHIARARHGLGDLAQEFQELLGTMAGHAIADDLARFHVQRGEQRGRAVALAIMGHCSRPALLLLQPRLGPVERPNLGFLVNAEHHSPVRRVKVKADDIRDLLLERRSFETLNPFVRCGRRSTAGCPWLRPLARGSSAWNWAGFPAPSWRSLASLFQQAPAAPAKAVSCRA